MADANTTSPAAMSGMLNCVHWVRAKDAAAARYCRSLDVTMKLGDWTDRRLRCVSVGREVVKTQLQSQQRLVQIGCNHCCQGGSTHQIGRTRLNALQ